MPRRDTRDMLSLYPSPRHYDDVWTPRGISTHPVGMSLRSDAIKLRSLRSDEFTPGRLRGVGVASLGRTWGYMTQSPEILGEPGSVLRRGWSRSPPGGLPGRGFRGVSRGASGGVIFDPPGEPPRGGSREPPGAPPGGARGARGAPGAPARAPRILASRGTRKMAFFSPFPVRSLIRNWGVTPKCPKMAKNRNFNLSRMGELLNTRQNVHFFAPGAPGAPPPGGAPGAPPGGCLGGLPGAPLRPPPRGHQCHGCLAQAGGYPQGYPHLADSPGSTPHG